MRTPAQGSWPHPASAPFAPKENGAGRAGPFYPRRPLLDFRNGTHKTQLSRGEVFRILNRAVPRLTIAEQPEDYAAFRTGGTDHLHVAVGNREMQTSRQSGTGFRAHSFRI